MFAFLQKLVQCGPLFPPRFSEAVPPSNRRIAVPPADRDVSATNPHVSLYMASTLKPSPANPHRWLGATAATKAMTEAPPRSRARASSSSVTALEERPPPEVLFLDGKQKHQRE